MHARILARTDGSTQAAPQPQGVRTPRIDHILPDRFILHRLVIGYRGSSFGISRNAHRARKREAFNDRWVSASVNRKKRKLNTQGCHKLRSVQVYRPT